MNEIETRNAHKDANELPVYCTVSTVRVAHLHMQKLQEGAAADENRKDAAVTRALPIAGSPESTWSPSSHSEVLAMLWLRG